MSYMWYDVKTSKNVTAKVNLMDLFSYKLVLIGVFAFEMSHQKKNLQFNQQQ